MTETDRMAAVSEQPAGPAGSPKVTIRDFPWPFRGMLAICSDIDDESPEHFAALHRFLNTREMTRLGRGLGLDVADSFWFYAPASDDVDPAKAQMSLFTGLNWKKRSPFAGRILDYIRGGWIDTLHSYGNFSKIPTGHPDRFTRAHAEHALGVLREEGLSIRVWSNHGDSNNIQNVERDDDMVGDVPTHPARHSDLTTRCGIRFIWSTEMSEDFRRDKVLTLGQLRDGQKIWKFSRQDLVYRDDAEELKARFGAIAQDTARGPMAVVWHPALLHVQLSPENLADLVSAGGYAIVGQHLGYRHPFASPGELLPPEAVAALHRLKAQQDGGGILVAGTARLLEYAAARETLRYETATDAAGTTVINITGSDDPIGGGRKLEIGLLRGITFEVAEGVGELRLCGQPVPWREITERQLPGKHIIGIRWFAPDYTDYSHG
jgi:hypothetical protein